MPAVAQTIKKLSPKGWAMVGGSVAAAVVFLVVVMQFASSPSYATLETGLDPAQTARSPPPCRPRGSPISSRTAAPRWPWSPARPRRRASRWPPPACWATSSRASR